MAIYHLSAKIIKRSAGRSAVAAAAYRAGAQFHDKRTGLTHSYTKRKDVVHCELLTPDVVPLFAADRSTLWNTVEQNEPRKDSQVAREIELALPVELTRPQQITLARDFVQDNFVSRGMIADIAIHDKDGSNPHAHIMLTMRELTPEGFGQKVRAWNSKDLLKSWRASWEKETNQALEKVGSKERIDHRTLKAQGIDREPQIHLGMSASALQAKNKQSDRTERLNHIKQHNVLYLAEIRALKEEQAKIEKEIAAYELDHRPPLPQKHKGSAVPLLETAPDLDPMEERMRAVNAALDLEIMTSEERFKKQKQWVETGQTLEEEAGDKKERWRKLEAREADIGKAGQEISSKLDEWSNGTTIEEEAKRHRDFVDQGSTIEEVAAERFKQLDKWQNEAEKDNHQFNDLERKKDMVLLRKLPSGKGVNEDYEEFRLLYSKDPAAAQKLPYYKVWQAYKERKTRKFKNEEVGYDVEEMHEKIKEEKQQSRNEEAALKREEWIQRQVDNGINFEDAMSILEDREKAKARKAAREKDRDNDLER